MIEDWELEDPELLDNDGEPIREVGERSQRQPIAGEEEPDVVVEDIPNESGYCYTSTE
jgi:hypothetical protein